MKYKLFIEINLYLQFRKKYFRCLFTSKSIVFLIVWSLTMKFPFYILFYVRCINFVVGMEITRITEYRICPRRILSIGKVLNIFPAFPIWYIISKCVISMKKIYYIYLYMEICRKLCITFIIMIKQGLTGNWGKVT